MRLAVTGHSGQVAMALVERAVFFGDSVSTIGRPEFDLADQNEVGKLFAEVEPDVIISAAAYTAVDKAESEPELAWRVNVDGAGAIARVAATLGVPLVHLSTDYVFDGLKSTPWVEDDATHPLGVYGATKLAGEELVRSVMPESVVLRIAWVYSPFSNNFVKTMLRLAETHDVLKIVADQVGCPTSALDIADGILAVARKIVARPRDRVLTGTFHMGATGEASWADFAEAIFSGRAARGGKLVAVRRVGTTEYPTLARRPANSRLDSHRLADVYGIVLPDWRVSLETVLDRLVGQRMDAANLKEMI